MSDGESVLRILYLHRRKLKKATFFFFFQKIIVKVNYNRIAGLLREMLMSNNNHCGSSKEGLQIKVCMFSKFTLNFAGFLCDVLFFCMPFLLSYN